MKTSLRRGLIAVLLIAALGMSLAGCGSFRQQALEAQTRLEEAVQRAEIAEDAATRNAARILELEHRIDALEETLAELEDLTDLTEAND